jgi:integrase
VAEEWYLKVEKEGLAPATLNKIRWLLDFAYPSFGNRPIAEILPHELLTVLRKFEAKGRHESAKRLRSTCGQVFRYAIATARANRDISADLRGALASVKVTHITTDMIGMVRLKAPPRSTQLSRQLRMSARRMASTRWCPNSLTSSLKIERWFPFWVDGFQ